MSRRPGPDARVLDGVPIGEFGLEQCGAGSLATVLAYWGEAVPIEELDRRLPKAENGGVLTLDLLLEARRRGYDAQLVEGSPGQIARTVAAGHPAILALQVLNMPGGRRDFFHYVVLDGYDPERLLVRLHFGDGVVRWASIEWLLAPWRGAGFAMILIEPRAAGLSADGEADEDERLFESALRYAVALEAIGELDAARRLYGRLLDERPDSALVWLNRGNAERAAGYPDIAETCYRRALELDPASADAANNLAWLLLETGGDVDEAVDLARRAVAVGGPDPYLALDTLARALRARGDCSGALEHARRARDLAPPDSAAAEALARALERTRAVCAGD
ncbi:MAG: tetratricopeptide repeat protein [Thermoanaerobaculia bacterium]|nr:tetratricopeptide repeat protein [Thermoanaerobaculia bacterium]